MMLLCSNNLAASGYSDLGFGAQKKPFSDYWSALEWQPKSADHQQTLSQSTVKIRVFLSLFDLYRLLPNRMAFTAPERV